MICGRRTRSRAGALARLPRTRRRGVAAAAAADAAATLTVAKPFFVRSNRCTAPGGESLEVKVSVQRAESRRDRDDPDEDRYEALGDYVAESTPVGSPATVTVRAGSFASATFAAFTPTCRAKFQ